MLQLIGLLAISWLLLWLFDKKNLSVLGLMPTKERLKYSLVLFLVSALMAATAYFLRMYFAKETYTIAPLVTARSVLTETFTQFRTVLTEELLCRGALLYILARKTGRVTAIIISSVIFAALHWLNAGVWGDLTQMLIVFGFTFAMGLLLAYAYTRTFSLLIPFAIHFGWNLVQNYVFGDAAAGNHLFVLAALPPTVTISYFAFFTMLLLPKISILVVDYFIVKRLRPVEIP